MHWFSLGILNNHDLYKLVGKVLFLLGGAQNPPPAALLAGGNFPGANENSWLPFARALRARARAKIPTK